jgi:hypothetical protein
LTARRVRGYNGPVRYAEGGGLNHYQSAARVGFQACLSASVR